MIALEGIVTVVVEEVLLATLVSPSRIAGISPSICQTLSGIRRVSRDSNLLTLGQRTRTGTVGNSKSLFGTSIIRL